MTGYRKTKGQPTVHKEGSGRESCLASRKDISSLPSSDVAMNGDQKGRNSWQVGREPRAMENNVLKAALRTQSWILSLIYDLATFSQ